MLNRTIDGAAPSVVVGVLVVSCALTIGRLTGATEFTPVAASGWMAVMAVGLALTQVAPARRTDPLITMALVTFLIVGVRAWLLGEPPLLGSYGIIAAHLLDIPAFLSVGSLSGAWLAPSLRVDAERVPAAVAGGAGLLGWWTILSYGAVHHTDRPLLRTTALVVCCVAAIVWVMGHSWLWSRRRDRQLAEILANLGAWCYFVGDIGSMFFTERPISTVLRLMIGMFMSLAVLASAKSPNTLPLAVGRDRHTLTLAILTPCALSLIPVTAWVGAGAEPPVWFAPAWVAGTFVVIAGMGVAMVAQFGRSTAAPVVVPARWQRHLHYQPIVRSTDGQLIGAEALFRINESQGPTSGGWIFGELAGSPDLGELTDWVMDEAFREGGQLLRELDDPEAFVSFNMSPEQFMSPGLIDRIDDALDRSGSDADGFMIEITELSFMNGSETVIDLVDRLHDRGFLIALDDFGSGFASLHSIVDVDFDLVKIDQSMVASTDKPRGQQVLGRTIDLLATSGLLVLAEGVETDEQFARVVDHRPHFIQGYATGMPMPLHELLDRMN